MVQGSAYLKCWLEKFTLWGQFALNFRHGARIIQKLKLNAAAVSGYAEWFPSIANI